MGFMFNMSGRIAFFVFVGTLAFGLGLAGLIIGIVTFVNMCWNIFIMCMNPGYFKAQSDKAHSELRQTVASEAAKFGARQAVRAMTENKNPGNDGAQSNPPGGQNKFGDEEFKMDIQPQHVNQAAKIASQWEMRTDEHSGTPYWVNNLTGEQSWDNPAN